MAQRSRSFVSLSIAVGAAIATPAMASDKLASGLGHDLAQHYCAKCHMIEPGQTNPPDHVGGPAFQDVADRPATTRKTLEKHLRTTHTNAMIPLSMPNPELTEDELVKILAYLTSLKTSSAAGK